MTKPVHDREKLQRETGGNAPSRGHNVANTARSRTRGRAMRLRRHTPIKQREASRGSWRIALGDAMNTVFSHFGLWIVVMVILGVAINLIFSKLFNVGKDISTDVGIWLGIALSWPVTYLLVRWRSRSK